MLSFDSLNSESSGLQRRRLCSAACFEGQGFLKMGKMKEALEGTPNDTQRMSCGNDLETYRISRGGQVNDLCSPSGCSVWCVTSKYQRSKDSLRTELLFDLGQVIFVLATEHTKQQRRPSLCGAHLFDTWERMIAIASIESVSPSNHNPAFFSVSKWSEGYTFWSCTGKASSMDGRKASIISVSSKLYTM